MGQFGTQTDVLRQAATRVQDVNMEIKAKLTALEGVVGGTSAFWKGTASSAFIALMERYNGDAAKLNNALNGIAEAMHQSGASYQATEESTTAAVQGAGSGLNL